MTPEQLETNLELATEALLEEREYAKTLALANAKQAETIHTLIARLERDASPPIVINNDTTSTSVDVVREIIGCTPNVSLADGAREVMRSLESLKCHRDLADDAAKAAGRLPGESVGELIARLKHEARGQHDDQD